MYNCIFTSHCTEGFCDGSCPALVETSYLLERNNINFSSSVFSEHYKHIGKIKKLLEKKKYGVCSIYSDSKNSVKVADLVTYCEICQNWKGSRLHCNVFNLRYSKFLDDTKKSWGMRTEPEDLQYTRIWADNAKVLIVSSMDYVKFGDYESQTLLNLIQSRQTDKKLTILITPPPERLVTTGSSNNPSLFFESLLRIIRDKENHLGVVNLA